MAFGFGNSFWAQEDNKKMLRHVIAMAGVSSSLVLCLHASAIQPEQAYADEIASGGGGFSEITESVDPQGATIISVDASKNLSDASDASSTTFVDDEGSFESDSGEDESALKDPSEPLDQADSIPGDSNAALPTTSDVPSDVSSGSSGNEEPKVPEPAPIPDKIEDGAYSIISALGTTLEVGGAATSDGGNVQTWDDNLSAAQRFHIKAEGQAESGEWYYSITNVNSGKVLDCVGGGMDSGTNVQQYAPNGTGAQQWFLRSVTDSSGREYFQIVNVRSGLVLDVLGANSQAGANVQIYSANGTAAQHWLLKKWIQEVTDGAYTIVSGLDSAYVIDISGASGEDCAAAQLYKSNGTLAQTFAINYDEYSGYYTLTSFSSGKKLDVAGGSADEGALVQQYGANGTRAQLWNIVKNSDGSITFVSAIDGHALDVMWGAAQNGTRLQQWRRNGSAAQRFFLREAFPVFDGGLVEIRNGANGYVVMDIPGASKDAGVGTQLYDQNRTFAQKYMVESDGEGSYRIRNIASGLYISVDAHGVVSQQDEDSSFIQLWTISATKTGHFALSPVGYSGFLGAAKPSSGIALSLLESCGLASTWNFVKAALIESGMYTIALAADNRYVLDVSGASLSYGGNVQAWESNGTNAQKFLIRLIGDNLYSITNAWSALALDVDGGQASAGTNVQQYGWNDTNAQKWIAKWDGHGGVVFKSAVGNCALSAVGAYSGGNAQLETFDVTDVRQRFMLSATSFSFASMDNQLDALESAAGWGLDVFKSLKGLSSQTWNDLWSAINSYTNDGSSVGFVMMDLKSGAGVSYNIDDWFYGASTVKGPYVAALNMYMPWVLNSWEWEMDQTIDISNNETYEQLRAAFGADPMYKLATATRAWDFNWDAWWVSYSTRTLAKLWVGMANYFMSDQENAWWCRDVYGSNTLMITSRATLSWKGCPIYAKSGWITGGPTAHDEACIVMDGDHPYLMVVMSNESFYNQWKMSNLMSVLDRAHSEII